MSCGGHRDVTAAEPFRGVVGSSIAAVASYRRLVAAAAGLVALGLAGCAPTSSRTATSGATSPHTAGAPAGSGQLALTGHTSNPGTGTWAPWPQAMHDGRRSAASTALGPRTGRLRWTRNLEGNVTPGPVIGPHGVVYAASNAGVLHAIDPVTGADRWTYDGHASYGSDLSTSPAVLPDGTILWPGPHDTLYALSPTGRLLWRQPLPGQPSSPAVAIDGHSVYVGDASGTVTAFDVHAATHRLRWQLALGATSYGSVALSPTDPRRIYQGTGSDLVALDDRGSSGTQAWRFPAQAAIEVSPAVGPDGTVVIGTNDPFEYGVTPTGTELWRYRRDAWTYSSAGVSADGLAYFGDHRGYLNAVDVRTGVLAARYQGRSSRPGHTEAEVWTAPAVDSAHSVYWGSVTGHLYADDATGRRLFDLDLGPGVVLDSYPALGADGLLVIGATDGRLIGIGDRR